MVGFVTLTGALGTLATLAVAGISYPSTVEVDLLFPRNETYNRMLMPVVFAVQNVQVAYGYEWSIQWEIYSVGSSSDNLAKRGIARSRSEDNEFQYYFNDVAIVPARNKYGGYLRQGVFRLEWDYATASCPLYNSTWTDWPVRRPIIWGTEYFSIVEDDSGSNFDIPLAECPSFGGTWTVDDEEDCPASSDDQDSDPCAAQLTSGDQVDCIREYLMTSDNETETCLSAFERADPDWPSHYYLPDSSGGSTNTDGNNSGSGSNESDTSSTKNKEDKDSSTGIGIAISLRPGPIRIISMLFLIAIITL